METQLPSDPVSLWGPGYTDGSISTTPCLDDSNDDIEDMALAFESLALPSEQTDIDTQHIRKHPVVDAMLAVAAEKEEEDKDLAPMMEQQQQVFLPGNASIWVKTMGCSHNVSDGEYMAGLLSSQGYKVLFEDSKKDQADLWLLNSCTVKGPSELTFINDIKKGMVAGKKVVVAGCVPQAAGAAGGTVGRAKGKGREWDGLSIVGVQQIDRVVEVVEETLKGNVIKLTKDKKVEVSVEREDADGDEVESEVSGGVQRGSVKKRKAGGAKLDLPKVRRNPYVEIIPINTGCLNQCTYCKTKHARGDLGSYPPEEIWSRVESVIQEGVKEIWLTSEDTGAYGIDLGVTIVDLLWGIVRVLEKYAHTGAMLRVGMTNPPYILQHLEEVAKVLSHPRVFAFLHVPVQSGSDAVLDAMRRQYTSSEFVEIVETLRSTTQGGCTVATDVICGFPTETQQDHDETMALLRAVTFNVLHISQFYSRPGTPAALMPRLPSEVVKARSREVSALFHTWFPYQGMEGTVVQALVTEVSSDGQFYVGHDKLYRQILVPMEERDLGRWVECEVVRTGKFFLEAKVLRVLGEDEEEDLEDVAAAAEKNLGTVVGKKGKGMVVKRRRAPKLVNVAGKMVKMGGDGEEAGVVADEGTVLSVPESFQPQVRASVEREASVEEEEEKRILTPAVSVGLGLVALAYGGFRGVSGRSAGGQRMVGAGLIVAGGLGLVLSGLFDLRSSSLRKRSE
ncbi:hypothetical protein HDU98_010763 [Podochytrium sp. JEL0797]|nr:hypothetical protein HDU98_010762 [Podochytrium sp. JEL0797]KAJ3065886.1 hypothetical protein HDU98_010763 [Podochytrium sp. JEL0797]